jgi:hypothetical protein
MTNDLVETIPLLAGLAEAGALIWAFARRNVNGVVLVNALGAAALLLLVVPHLGASIRFVDIFLLLQLMTLAFALATLMTSLSYVAYPVFRPWVVWTEFSVMAGLSAGFLAFIFALRIARLI